MLTRRITTLLSALLAAALLLAPVAHAGPVIIVPAPGGGSSSGDAPLWVLIFCAVCVILTIVMVGSVFIDMIRDRRRYR